MKSVSFIFSTSWQNFLKYANSHSLLNTWHIKALHSVQLAEHRMTQGNHAGGRGGGESRKAEATEVQALKQLISLERLSLTVILSYIQNGSASVQTTNSPLVFDVCSIC